MTPSDPGYPIQPEHIDASKHMYGAFDHNETEVSAGYIVRMCQDRGEGWAPFTKDQIESRYQKAGHKDGFWFNNPLSSRQEQAWIREEGDLYHISHDFVSRCFKSSPVKGAANA